MKQIIKDLLVVLIPIGIISYLMGFVKAIFIKEEGSAYSKILKFFGSSTFGIIIGFITSKFTVEQGWVLGITSGSTLLADQIITYIDKFGLKGLIIYLKDKIKNIPVSTPENPTQNPPSSDGK